MLSLSQQQSIKEAANKYNTPLFSISDPIQFPDKYATDARYTKRDAEISAFLTSWIAYGSRTQIIKKAAEINKMFEGSPSDFILLRKWDAFTGLSDPFYRLFKTGDFAALCAALFDVYSCFNSLEDIVIENMQKMDLGLIEALELPFHGLTGIPDPAKGSACKRLCMFLRWMVRRDKIVDFGLWGKISPEDLIIPLDTHVHKIALELGITTRKSADMKAAKEITDEMRKIFPTDPALGDFALFGLGIDPDGSLLEQWEKESDEALCGVVGNLAQELKEEKAADPVVEQIATAKQPAKDPKVMTKAEKKRIIRETTSKLINEERDRIEQGRKDRIESINKTFEENRALMVASTYNILFSTKIAALSVYDLPRTLEAEGLYKMGVKKQVNDLIRATQNFERTCYSVYGDKAKFFEDSVNRLMSEIGIDIQKLYFSIKAYLDKFRVKASSALAYMEQTRTLIALSVEIHKTRINKVRSINPDLPGLEYLCMDKILHLADSLSLVLNRSIDRTINLNEDLNCTLAVSIIDKKIADDERIARAILLTN